ncbi:MAG: hypothetical protein EAZ85_05820 [Bacteroidetes bacterium]|nr:MAG: hypothetical protein EAZ85_05820 [Bacteroidota bacterium]TAG95099.1 MAG: hypothetical protein EAZ20_00460 [Bacteroidota bacterium]
MTTEIYVPRSLSLSRMDKYLASGWFRAGMLIYKSEIACLEDGLWPVVNIRLVLPIYEFKKRWRKLLKQNSQQLTHKISILKLTERHQEMYDLHKKRCRGVITPKLHDYFYGSSWTSESVFNTYQVDVYLENKIIATSFFDIGKHCLVSILGLYDDEYKRYSLGNYTMLLEIEHAKSLEKKYYYPGYILKGCSLFDYKLELGEMQYYSWQGRWRKWDKLSEEKYRTDSFLNNTKALFLELLKTNIECEEVLYVMFGIVYDDRICVNAPICIAQKNYKTKDGGFWAIEYNDLNNQYTLGICYCWDNFRYLQFTPDFKTNPRYCLQTICYENILIQTASIQKIITVLKDNLVLI